MKFEVTFEKNEVFQSNLVEARDSATATAFFQAYKPDATVIEIREATADSYKPGKPVIKVPADFEPEKSETEKTELLRDCIGDLNRMADVYGKHGLDTYYLNMTIRCYRKELRSIRKEEQRYTSVELEADEKEVFTQWLKRNAFEYSASACFNMIHFEVLCSAAEEKEINSFLALL